MIVSKTKKVFHPLALFLFIIAVSYSQSQLQITIPPNSPERIFSFTNKRNAFYCGVVNGNNSSGFHGITQSWGSIPSGKEKLFENYWIQFGEEILNRKEAIVVVTPWNLTRIYSKYNTKEEIFFSDNLILLSVRITSDYRGPVTIIPAWSSRYAETIVENSQSSSLVLSGTHRCQMTMYQSGEWKQPEKQLRNQLRNPAPFVLPKIFNTQFNGSIAFSIEFIPQGGLPPQRSPEELNSLALQKKERITHLINHSMFQSNNDSMNQLYPWILSSMNALVMHGELSAQQSGTGLYAGLPWFDDFWGRDTFISLPGAFLVTGDFENAKKVLRSFIQYQNKISGSPNYGRIPNRVTPKEIIYNSVDGTPWLVHQAYQYMLYSGDIEFAKEIFPSLDIAIEGSKKFHLDQYGFLTHDDADTWMDAVGDRGAWSPRGNRAVEIQTLWINQLEISVSIARMINRNDKSDEWTKLLNKVRENFTKFFTQKSTQILVDRLKVSGIQDEKIRPNALIALSAFKDQIIPEPLAFNTVKKIFESCVYTHGVASLNQYDDNFHPYHQYPGYYPKDAAYHNGVIWTWLSGPAITVLCRYGLQDSAFHLTETLNDLAMNQGQVGSLPELTDALPRDDNSKLSWSGTFSQAWSLAEYLRNLYQDYLGIHPDALKNKLHLDPRLPKKMLKAETTCRFKNTHLHIQYDFTNPKQYDVEVERLSGNDTIEVELSILHKHVEQTYSTSLPVIKGSKKIISFNAEQNKFLMKSDEAVIIPARALPVRPDDLKTLKFCAPYLRHDLPSIKKPAHTFLEGQLVCSKNPKAVMLFEKSDPEGDDNGPTKTYSYPRNENFTRGIFDIKSLSVSTDNEMVYFNITMKKLVQPGWHPEYGFQLTMLSLAIDCDGLKRSGSRYIRQNAHVNLPDDMWYDRMILIGGGIQVFDKYDAILCEYIPTEDKYAFGNVDTGIISFAIPIQFLGRPNPHWDYYLCAGGQDDHGGGGIGEFRTVLPEATEWNGGGNEYNGPNVYDVLKSR